MSDQPWNTDNSSNYANVYKLSLDGKRVADVHCVDGADEPLVDRIRTSLNLCAPCPLGELEAYLAAGGLRKMAEDHDNAGLEAREWMERSARLLEALKQAVNFIEHSEANRGKCTTDEEWDRNVEEFRQRSGQIGIGRSYTDKAAVDLTSAREIIEEATRAQTLSQPLPAKPQAPGA